MATIIFCDGQALLVNLDNVDFIRLANKGNDYFIEFYKSERISREQKPTFVNCWTFRKQDERDLAIEKIIDQYGSKIKLN